MQGKNIFQFTYLDTVYTDDATFLAKEETWIKELKKCSLRFRNILFSIQVLKNVKLQERVRKYVDLYIVIITIRSVPFPCSKSKQNEKIKLYRSNNKKSHFTGIMADSNSYCLGQICFWDSSNRCYILNSHCKYYSYYLLLWWQKFWIN